MPEKPPARTSLRTESAPASRLVELVVEEWSVKMRGALREFPSGANPDGLRGPEHDFAWCDELAKWCHPERTWHNLMLGLRRSDGR